MNSIGVCTWVGVSPFTDDDAVSLTRSAKEAGADVLEVAIEEPDLVTAETIRAAGEAASIAFSEVAAKTALEALAS